MKNNFTKILNYSLSMTLLAMMMTLGLFNAKGQSIDIVSIPVEQQFVGGTATFSYNATDFPVSATQTVTFFLFYVNDGDPLVLEEDKVLASSTVQSATTTLNITWPVFEVQDKAIDLKFAAYSGDVFSSDDDFDITEEDLIITSGADANDSYDISFYKAGERRATTDPFDVDFDENVRVHVELTDNSTVEARPLVVQYSTNGIAGPFTTLVVDDAFVDTMTPTTELFDFNGTDNFYFDLPAGAKTAATTFQVLQVNSTTISTSNETWSLNAFDVSVGDIFTLIDPPGVTANSSSTDIIVSIPTLDVTDVMTGTTSIDGAYAGNVINVAVELEQVDLTGYGFAIQLEGADDNYLLTSQDVLETSQASGTLVLTGTIPPSIEYSDDMTVAVYAYDKDDDGPIFGLSYNINAIDPADIEFEGGDLGMGNSVVFQDAGDRSVTFPAIDFPAIDDDSKIEFTLAKTEDQLSPSGTDIILKYSADGGAFVELGTVAINELTTGGDIFSFVGDEIPAGLASSSTILRLEQEGNNGQGLDGWKITAATAESGSNIASSTAVSLGTTEILDVWRPDVTVDAIPITFDNRPFPMVDYTLTYTIEDGAFPVGTGAMVMLQRQGGPTGSDIILGSVEDITDGEVEIKVPPIAADEYTLYLMADHIASDDSDSQYGDVSLPIENISIDIVDHTFANSVTIGNAPFGLAGTAITVNYTVSEIPGDDAELMLKVYDYHTDVDDYVLIGASTTIELDGSITATLPTGIVYQDDSNSPKLSLSLGNGVFTRLFGDLFIDDRVDQFDDEFFLSIEGNSSYAGFDEAFTSEGVRAITTQPFDMPYGGQVRWRYQTEQYTSAQSFRVEGSVDGDNWNLIEDYDFPNSDGSTTNTNNFVPPSLNSASTRFRLIYNDNFGPSDFEDNILIPIRLRVRRSIFLETQETNYGFDLTYPEINVATLDAEYTIGESITVNYNAFFFPDDVEFAAVLEQGDNYTVLGTNSDQDASSISGVLPFSPLDPTVGDTKDYTISIIPFVPDVAGGDYLQDQTIELDKDDDFIAVEGSEAYIDTNDKVTFEFRDAGNRSVLTGALDLTMAESVRLKFDYNKTNDYSSFSIDDNKNVVPRLEVSIDAGATFQTIPVYMLDEDEEQIYDDGLLYTSGNYEVYIPEEYQTDATHFKFSQPLNQGDEKDIWEVRNFKLKIGSGNEFDEDMYAGSDQDQDIDVLVPDIADYAWAQNDQDDPVFNGDSFDFVFGVKEDVEDADVFPPGTMFMFTLPDVIDPDTNDPYVLGTTSELGVSSASIPFYVINDNYNVHVKAYLMVEDDEPFVMHEDVLIGDLDVFLKAVKLTFLGEDDLATLYAGESVEFSIDVENVETASNSFDDLYATLIVDYLDKDWILATQQGIDNMTIDLPPFIQVGATGYDAMMPPTFSVKLTENEPLGEAGTIYEMSDNLSNLATNANNFLSGTESGNVISPQGSGRLLITTKDIDSEDLADASLLSYKISFDKLPEELTEDQYVMFEVSTDGGATYDVWETFPESNALATLTDEYFVYQVTDAMKAGTTRLRWRQEESQGNFSVKEIEFSFGEVLPFDYVDATIDDIQNQAVIITSIDSEEACIDDYISINYEIRGAYGDDTQLDVEYSGSSTGWIYDVDFVSQGTGTIMFNMPNELLAEGAGSGDYEFKLSIDDMSFDDLINDETSQTTYDESKDQSSNSEQSVSVVAPIDVDQKFTITNDQILCLPEDIIITVDAPKDNFTYDIIDVASGSIVGSLTYDAVEADNEINIGMMTGTFEIGMIITSATESGAVCNSLTTTWTDIVASEDIYSLYRSRNATTAVPSVGESETVCTKNALALVLSLWRQTDSNTGDVDQLLTAADVEWFRDDFSNPVSGTSLKGYEMNVFDRSGNYFARVTNDGCQYVTESIAVEVIEDIIDIPEITVVSGDLISCDADINVVLSAPAGFEYYEWTGIVASTQNVTITDAGTYSVKVSNVPFSLSCQSPKSVDVVVESAGGVSFQASLIDNDVVGSTEALGTVDEVEDGDELEACDEITVYFYEDAAMDGTDSPDNSGSVVIFRDGVEYASSVSDSYVFQESGTYSMTWMSDDLTYRCSETIGDFTVIINETPIGKPVITTSGALMACGDDLAVMITAMPGYSHYEWDFGGVSTVSTSNTFEAINPGDYKVAVGNSEECVGEWSRIITLSEVAVDNNPDITLVANENCGSSATTIEVDVSQASHSYQIHNATTDLAEGSPVAGNGGVITLTSAAHDEVTDFYVIATRVDGSGCSGTPSDTETGGVNNVLLRASGNIITAQIESVTYMAATPSDPEVLGYEEIIWYRNGAKMLNVEGNSGSITVIDDATYSVEVIFGTDTDGACSVTSNAVTLGGGAGGNVTIPEFATSIYPNPTRDEFNLKVDGEDFGIYSVQIVSLSGKVVFTDSYDKQTVDFTVPISITHLKAGIYTLITNSDNNKSINRIVKF